MSLLGKIRRTARGVVGNRATLLGLTMFTAGHYAYWSSDELGLVGGMLSVYASSIGGFLVGYTMGGYRTQKHFYKTDKHISGLGFLDEKFTRKIIEENAIGGEYCSVQGVYLAAKKHGVVDSFREYEKKYSKWKIPRI